MNEINNRVIELCKQLKNDKTVRMYDVISENINKEFNEDYNTEKIRHISRAYRRENNLDENFKPMPISDLEPEMTKVTTQILADGTRTSDRTISVGKDVELTPEVLLSKHGFDPCKFKLISAKNSIWDGQKKGGNTVKFYSSKISVKPVDDFVITTDYINEVFNKARYIKSSKIPNKTSYEENGQALVIPVVDLHWALHSYMEVAGNDYDEEVATSLIKGCLLNILSRVRGRKFEKIFFTIGNDMINYDNVQKTTEHGTPQDGSIPVELAMEEVTDILIWCIETLRQVSNVEVVHVPGNHDRITGAGIANALRVFYSKCDDVTVDSSPIDRKYKVFGNTLIGFAHDVNVKNINDIIQADARDLLANTTHTIYLLAHLHHEHCIDIGGTDVRRLPTMSAPSRWTYTKGYSSVRKNQSFIIDSEYGITDIIYTIVK